MNWTAIFDSLKEHDIFTLPIKTNQKPIQCVWIDDDNDSYKLALKSGIQFGFYSFSNPDLYNCPSNQDEFKNYSILKKIFLEWFKQDDERLQSKIKL